MTHIEHARDLVALNPDDPFWPRKLLHATEARTPPDWAEAIVARAGELAAAGETAEVAQLTAFFEVRAARLLPAEQLAQLEGPSVADLERDAELAELRALREEAVRWWCVEYPVLCGIRGVEPTFEEVPEFAHEACSREWNAVSLSTAETAGPLLEMGAPKVETGLHVGVLLEPLSDWSEEEIRHDWRGMTATEKRVYREAFLLAKPHERERSEAARYAHRRVIDYRVRRAEAGAEQVDGRSAA